MMQKKQIRNKKIENSDMGYSQNGFTVIELVVYMAIFSILVGVLTTAFLSILNSQLSSQTISSTDENGKYLLARLSYDITRSQNIITPATPGSQSASLQLRINNINYSYTLDANGNFQIKDITDNLGPYDLNDYDASVSGLSFTRIGNMGGKNTIQVAFTIVSATQSKTDQSKSYSTTIGTR